MHGGNLVFVKHEQLPEKIRSKLTLVKCSIKGYSIRHIQSSIEAFLVKDAQRKRQYARCKGDKQYRIRYSRENQYPLPFTVYQASKWFKVSTSHASRMLIRLSKENWYVRRRRFKTVSSSGDIYSLRNLFNTYRGPLIYLNSKVVRPLKSLIEWNINLKAEQHKYAI